MPKEGQIIKTKYISPDPRLIKYIKEKPLVQKMSDDLKFRKEELERKASKSLLSGKEEKELRDIETKLIKLKSKLGVFSDDKRKILDEIVFPSMANLTFFFEAVSTIGELDFESNIHELLGITRDNPRAFDGPYSKSYAFMFKELMRGILGINLMDDEGTSGKIDFRLRLIHDIQTLIFHKILVQKILLTPKATSTVLNDISRAMAWTEMFASRVKDVYDLSKLSPRYDKKVLDNCKDDAQRKRYQEEIDKKTLEDFEREANKIVLHRSFDYDFKQLTDVTDRKKYVEGMLAAIKRK